MLVLHWGVLPFSLRFEEQSEGVAAGIGATNCVVVSTPPPKKTKKERKEKKSGWGSGRGNGGGSRAGLVGGRGIGMEGKVVG